MPLRREVPQRQVELGGENEHGESGLEADPSVHEPDADRDRDERDPERRRKLEHRTREEGDSQRSHRRAAIAVADRRDLVGLGLAAVERTQRRQPADDVEEVGRQEHQRLPALTRSVLRVAPDEPHEDRDERQREQHEPGRDEVERGHEREDGNRDDDGEHDLRQVAGVGGLERVDARDGGRRHLGALDAVEGGRLALQAPLDEVEPQRREDAHGGSSPDGLEAPGCQCPPGDDEDQKHERGGHIRQRRAVEGPGGDARDQDGLGEDEERGGDPEYDVGAEGDARCPGSAQQAPLDSHYSRGFRAITSAGVPTGVPPRRARRTW